MKLMISKSKDGNSYYSKITNEFNGQKTEMFLSLQLSKSMGELEYGMYNVDGFMSCYKAKDGTVKPKLIITKATPVTKNTQNKNTIYAKDIDSNSVFEEFAKEIEIEDNMLE